MESLQKDEPLALHARASISPNMVEGIAKWDPIKSIWFSAMTVLGLVGGVIYFNWTALLLFGGATAVLVLFGHSIGMHRLLIHRAFKCSKALEYILVYLGVLVGMAGPRGMARVHDARDYAQKQPVAHDYFIHSKPVWLDGWWQLHCSFQHAASIGAFATEQRIQGDRIYQFLERTWMWHQLPLAVLFYSVAGWGGIFLGVCARVSICIFGHWLITYVVHRRGPMPYEIVGACVQGHNNVACALITAGESLHSNHHAFPGSANYAIGPGELDPGWWVLKVMASLGLVWDLKTPDDLPYRPELRKYC